MSFVIMDNLSGAKLIVDHMLPTLESFHDASDGSVGLGKRNGDSNQENRGESSTEKLPLSQPLDKDVILAEMDRMERIASSGNSGQKTRQIKT